jgi:hypothetical protein
MSQTIKQRLTLAHKRQLKSVEQTHHSMRHYHTFRDMLGTWLCIAAGCGLLYVIWWLDRWPLGR